MKPLLIIFICGLLSLNLYSQEYAVQHLTVEDGLPSNRVYYIHKDSKGYIWFCTDLGVCRYNGLEIETFTTNDGLADNDIFNCSEDKWGRIWFASYNGEISYFKDGKFFNKTNSKLVASIIPRKNSFIAYYFQSAADSSIEIVYEDFTTDRMRIHRNEVIYDTVGLPVFEENPAYESYDFIYENANETSFVKYFVKAIPSKKNLIVSAVKKGKETGFREDFMSFNFRVMLTRNGKELLLCFRNVLYNASREKYIPITVSKKDQIYAYLKTGNTEYVGFKNGLRIVEENNSTIHLKDKFITSIQADEFQNVFCSTYGNGVYIFSKKMQFKTIPIKTNAALYTEKIRLLANKNSFFLYNYPSNKLIHQKNKHVFPEVPLEDKIVRLQPLKNSIYSISKFGTVNKIGLNHNFINTQDYLSIESAHYFGFLTGDYLDFLKFNDSTILISQITRLTSINPDNPKSIIYSTDSSRRLFNIDRQSDNTFWVSTKGGVFQVFENCRTKRFPHLDHLKLKKICTLQDKLFGIDASGNIFCIDQLTDPLRINVKKILPHIKSIDLKKLNNHTILIEVEGSLKICLQFKKNKTFSLYPTGERLTSQSMNSIISDGSLLFLSNRSTTDIIPIKEIPLPRWKPTIRKKDIVVNGISTTSDNPLEINYGGRNDIMLRYSINTKPKESIIYYEYALLTEGAADTIWTPTNHLEVQLNSPTWGNYIVLFRAKNYFNATSEIAASEFIILPPIYIRWWFILGILLAISGITFFTTRQWQNAKRKRELEKKELEKEFIKSEFKSLNALMNPHFIFNSLNNIQGFINNDSKEEANKYLEVFAQLVRQNMHNVKLGSITLEKEMYLVQNYLALEKMRFKEKIEYEITINENVEIADILIPPLTIQPIIENSIKHGILPLKNKTGKISITLTQDDTNVLIKVQDNGVGLTDHHQSKGNRIALDTIQERFVQIEKMTGYQIAFNLQNRLDGDQIIGTLAVITIEIPGD